MRREVPRLPAVRRSGVRALLVLAVALFALGVFGSTRRLGQVYEASTATDSEAAWIVQELGFEVQRLLVAGERYLRQPDEGSRRDLALRLDILWSRLPLVREGRQGELLRRTTEIAAIARSLEAVLHRFDPSLGGPRPPPAEVEAFLGQLGSFVAPLRRVVLDVMAQSARREALLREKLDQHLLANRLAIGGLTGALAILLALLWRESRHTLRLLDLSRRQEQDERHRAQHDPLTGLANRRLFEHMLAEAARRARCGEEPFALLLLDLDRFKEVNDTLGHDAGDRLLQVVAARLRGQVRQGDLIARLGGDEFAILQADARDAEMADGLARRLVAALSQTCEIEGHRLRIGASIGIALAPDHSVEGERLVRLADRALYRAKAEGGGVVLATADDTTAGGSASASAG